MPSIEVVCEGQVQPSSFERISFAIVSNATLRSHRGPSSLFQRDFDGLAGCVYHFGNPNLIETTRDGPFFAYELLNDLAEDGTESTILEFAPQFRSDVRHVLETLMTASPVGRLLFTSDWQFGPDDARRFQPASLREFWQLHDEHELLLNAAYPILAA